MREVRAQARPGAVHEGAERSCARQRPGTDNLMPYILDAVRAYATEGEIMGSDDRGLRHSTPKQAVV